MFNKINHRVIRIDGKPVLCSSFEIIELLGNNLLYFSSCPSISQVKTTEDNYYATDLVDALVLALEGKRNKYIK